MKRKKILIPAILSCILGITGCASAGVPNYTVKDKTNIFTESKQGDSDKEKYQNKTDLKTLLKTMEGMQKSGKYDLSDIKKEITKVSDEETRDKMLSMVSLYSEVDSKQSGISLKGLLDKLINTVKSLISGVGSAKIPVEATHIEMTAKTASEFAGKDFGVKLHANVYKHVNEKGQEDSDKWVVLIHPFMLKGTTIANAVGPAYYQKGYNILAPDLRSFGKSEGNVSLGCLEAMDIYDWLCLLNNEYDVSKVMVHGISLGGATTNFLSGIDQFTANGPKKIGKLKSLKQLKVIGLVEDCGYVYMEDFAPKAMLLALNIGLTKDNFDYYSKATNSLKYSDLPMMVIHGTGDTTVKYENANLVKEARVKGSTEIWTVDGAVHAFAIMGMNKDAYTKHVQDFITKVGG